MTKIKTKINKSNMSYFFIRYLWLIKISHWRKEKNQMQYSSQKCLHDMSNSLKYLYKERKVVRW